MDRTNTPEEQNEIEEIVASALQLQKCEVLDAVHSAPRSCALPKV